MPLVCNVSLDKKAKQKGNATAPPAKTINSRSERILGGMKGGEMLERRKRNSSSEEEADTKRARLLGSPARC
jgi:hypothetical protein